MQKCFIVLLVFFFIEYSIQIYSQYQNVQVGNAINPYEPVEPSIIINPYNSNYILGWGKYR